MLVVVALIAGCARPSVDPPTGDLAGTWQGSFPWLGAVLYVDEGSLFHVAKDSLPAWSSLTRSGDVLYGVAKNPAAGADIAIKLERPVRSKPVPGPSAPVGSAGGHRH